MALQRNRQYSLIVGDLNTPEGIEISQLQVRFDISKSSNNKERTNSATIEIYNLSDEHIKLLNSDYPVAVFSAGYVDTGGVKRLFAGEITQVTTRKNGTDRVTQLQMGTGYTELNHQQLNSLAAPGKTYKDVIDENIKPNLPGVDRGVYAGLNCNNQVIWGYSLSGTPKEMLNEICESAGMEWSMEDNVLYIRDQDGTTDENFDQAYVVNKDSGLVENAYYTSGDRRRSKKDKVKKQGVQWKMLLNAEIIPGSIVKLEDTLISGWFKVDSVRHYGDFRGNDWYSEVFCSAKEKVILNNQS